LNRKTVALTIIITALMLTRFIPPIPSVSSEQMENAQEETPQELKLSEYFVEPIIYHADAMDRDADNIQDRLESLVSQTLQVNESAILPVVVTLVSSVAPQDLEHFRSLGGEIKHIYNSVTYGFAGTAPASNLSLFASQVRKRLSMIEYDMPLNYHLDVSTSLIRTRPTVWNTYGYRGSPNHSIAILDTGIDDSHPDLGPYEDLNFSQKIVGWYDATSDSSSTPEDYGEHGSHVAGTAAGTGAANSIQGAGTIQTTFAYVLPISGYGYIDYIDVLTPGVIQLNLQWNGPNTVLLRLYDPAGTIVEEVIKGTPPSTIQYSTESSSYPTGRYQVLVGNSLGPSGAPFSCTEEYPYAGLDDGYGPFTGMAPESKLVGVKVFDNTGSGTLGTLINAMDWIIANRKAYNIVVASMSLSLENGATDTTLDQKADTMVQNGIVTIASAGNEYPYFTIGSPGTAAYVLTVGATNDQNGVTAYSSNGNTAKNEYGLIKPDVTAPGGTFSSLHGNRIISADSNDVDGGYSGFPDQNPNDYQQMGGTSMSAPHVAGLAALAAQALGGWNWTLEEALKVKMLTCMTAFETQEGEESNVPPLDRGEKDGKEGYGRVNADAIIEAATLNYSVGEEANAIFGLNPSDKRVWARRVDLSSDTITTFNLTVPAGADYDLYLYNGTPDSYGQPVISARSVNASLGTSETVRFTPNTSDTYYVVVKWVNGEGQFMLSSSQTLLRDVATTHVTVSDTAVYTGEIVNITVTVHNYGKVAESFDIKIFANDSVIETRNVSDLAIDTSEVLTFNWNTSDVQPCGNYTIKAETSVLPDESNTVNNTYIDGSVKVKMPGDINGDGAVNVVDLSIVALAYGSFAEEPDYNPDADLNDDDIVDMKDLFVVARNLGKTCV
jgi:subtilisin family serine protease